MTENEVAKRVVDAAYRIHTAVGPGLLESAYQAILAYELQKDGMKVDQQVLVSIRHESLFVPDAFRADMIVEDLVIIELKSVEQASPLHKKQLLTYLKLANKRLGLLLNFGAPLIRDGIHRIANGLTE